MKKIILITFLATIILWPFWLKNYITLGLCITAVLVFACLLELPMSGGGALADAFWVVALYVGIFNQGIILRDIKTAFSLKDPLVQEWLDVNIPTGTMLQLRPDLTYYDPFGSTSIEARNTQLFEKYNMEMITLEAGFRHKQTIYATMVFHVPAGLNDCRVVAGIVYNIISCHNGTALKNFTVPRQVRILQPVKVLVPVDGTLSVDDVRSATIYAVGYKFVYQ